MKYTQRIGYHYSNAKPQEAADTGLAFTLTTTLRGNTFRAFVHTDGSVLYHRNGKLAVLPNYALGLRDAANRLYGHAKKSILKPVPVPTDAEIEAFVADLAAADATAGVE